MRNKFTDKCRPENNDVIMLCSNDGKIFCGVVHYPNKLDRNQNSICISMFVNDVETDGSVEMDNIRWWHLLPLTKEELYSGNSQI